MKEKKLDIKKIKSPFEKRIASEFNLLLELKEKSSKFDFEVLNTIKSIPIEYKITYYLKSIVGINKDLSPIFADSHIVIIKLNQKYPIDRPIVFAESPIWHPNVKWNGVLKGRFSLDIGSIGAWHDLSMLVVHIAAILQWKNYHAENTPPYPEDVRVAKWVREYAEPHQIVDKFKSIYIDSADFINLKDSYKSKNENEDANLIVRILPIGDDVEINLPLTTTSKELIKVLLSSSLGIRKKDNQNNEIIYQLVPKASGIPLNENETLFEANVKEGDVILMTPQLFADKAEDEKLILSVIILPMNNAFDIELPKTSNGKVIKEALAHDFSELKNSIEKLKLIVGKSGEEIFDNQNLFDFELENGDNLILSLIEKKYEEAEVKELNQFKENLIEQLGLSGETSLKQIHEEIELLIVQVKKKNELTFLIDKWIQELSKSKIDKVSQELLKYCRKNHLKEFIPPVLQQSARWNAIHKRSIEGTLSDEEFILQLNKINSAVINIIMELEEL